MEENAPQPEAAQESPESPAAPVPAHAISRARKIRLAVLFCVLIALTAVMLLYRAKLRRDERLRLEATAAALADLRQVVQGLDPRLGWGALSLRFGQADALYRRIKDLDPGNRDADRLGVALLYAGGRLDGALELFNGLDVKKIAEELDRSSYRRANQALDPFPILIADASVEEIHGLGVYYLRECGFLWGLGRVVTRAAAGDRDKGLLLCRWMALHLLPEQEETVPAGPYLVTWRNHGSPVELAWTYSEMARQVGLRCKVAMLAAGGAHNEKEYLVQVYPADGAPFLLDPYLGIPIVDPASGELLSLESLADNPEAYDALLRLGGAGSAYGADDFRTAELKTAVHPYACFPRFLVFDHLLSALPAPPTVAFDFGPLPPDEGLDLWEGPVELLSQMQTGRYLEQSAEIYGTLEMLRGPRLLQLQGHHRRASPVYDAVARDLEKMLSEADATKGLALLNDGLESARFFRAVNSHDAGALPQAEQHARDYLEQYPEGRWRMLAEVLLGEVLSARGESDAAAEVWTNLPGTRTLYGALRLKGLLPMATLVVTPVTEAPPAGEEGPTQADSP